MIERIYEEPTGKCAILPPIIKTKLTATRNFSVPACDYCVLDITKKRSTGTTNVNHLPEKEVSLKREKYEVGDFVSTDQFIFKNPGRLPTGYGRDSTYRRFQGGTIYNDSASGLIFIENQVSLRSNVTVMVN